MINQQAGNLYSIDAKKPGGCTRQRPGLSSVQALKRFIADFRDEPVVNAREQ